MKMNFPPRQPFTMQCTLCQDKEASQLVNGSAACDVCTIGVMRVEPNTVFPFHDLTLWGDRRTNLLHPLGLENLPAAVDMADELFTLERMRVQARLDMVAATHMRILSILGERQYKEEAYNAFTDDMMAQARETKAIRIQFFTAGRDYSPDFMALSVAAMYVAWIADQKKRTQAHMERVDGLLTLKIGGQRALSIERQIFARLGKWHGQTTKLPSIEGELTRQKLDDALSKSK